MRKHVERYIMVVSVLYYVSRIMEGGDVQDTFGITKCICVSCIVTGMVLYDPFSMRCVVAE